MLFKTLIFASAIAMAPTPGPLGGGSLDFYEGNNGTQNKVGTLSDKAGQSYNLKKLSNFDNDEARSLTLSNVRVGCKIFIYDDPKGRANKDDWIEIEVLRNVQQYTIRSFEKSYNDGIVKVTFHRNNGLDGKVSHIKVR